MTLTDLQANPAVWLRMREHLRSSGYTEQGIVDYLGGIEMPKPEEGNLPRLLYRTRSGSKLDTLLRLFLFGVPAGDPEAESALAPALTLNELLETGLLTRQKDTVQTAALIVPIDGFYVAFDTSLHFVSGGSPDAIVGVSNSSRLVADIAIRTPVDRALDFGSGCGFQSLHAARHCREVIAIDLNPRAAMFTSINALLNGLPNITPVVGDGYAPVAGQTFDLIVGNLPFVINPGQSFVYRDNPMERDEFVRQILRETPPLLNEGGFAHFSASWVHLNGESGDDRLAELFEESGCDVWAAVTDVESPEEYAEKWISQTEAGDPETMLATFNEWMAYYEREGITRLSTGVLTLRKRTGTPNWLRIEPSPARAAAVGSFADSVEALFTRQDLVFSLSDEELLAAPLRVSADLQMIQDSLWEKGVWHAQAFQLRLNESMIQRGSIEATALAMLTRCDGQPLRKSIAALASALRAPVAQLTPKVLPVARQWVQLGYLTLDSEKPDQAGSSATGGN